MPTRRPLLKRVAVWTAAVILLLAGYAASPPFVAYWCQRHFPAAIPILRGIWSPLSVYSQRPQLPGSRAYVEYQMWSQRVIREHLVGRGDPHEKLNELTEIQFVSTPLRDVVAYLEDVHDYPIDLEPDVDDDVEVTVNTSAPLKAALAQILGPQGLTAGPAEWRIVIGSPATVQQIVAAAQAAEQARARQNRFVLAGLLSILALAILLIRRARLKRRSASALETGPQG